MQFLNRKKSIINNLSIEEEEDVNNFEYSSFFQLTCHRFKIMIENKIRWKFDFFSFHIDLHFLCENYKSVLNIKINSHKSLQHCPSAPINMYT